MVRFGRVWLSAVRRGVASHGKVRKQEFISGQVWYGMVG